MRNPTRPLLALLSVLLLSLPLLAADDPHARAEELLTKENWKEAAGAFETIVKEQPSDAAAWAGLGLARFQQKDVDGSADAYARALALEPELPRALFGMVRVDVARGDVAATKAAMTKAKNAGVPVNRLLAQLPGLDAMKKNADFASFLDSLRPCTGAEFHQFDFWLGEWDVFDPSGKQIGTSSVRAINDGCVLQESWRSLNGGTGSSFNFYEPTTRRWHQFWVDSTENAQPLSVGPDGAPAPLSGNLVDGKMILTSTAGTSPWNQWSWSRLDQGRVRQLAEQSKDGGKTWTTAFEGIYVPKKK